MYKSKSFFIFGVGVITIALLQINPAYGIKCYQCNSTQDGCGQILDKTKFNLTDCGDEGCVLYATQENATTDIKYKRTCGTVEDACQYVAIWQLISCSGCQSDGCNENVNTMGKHSCVECSSEEQECQSDDVSDNTSLKTCILDDVKYTKCVAYKAIADNMSYVTERGCKEQTFCYNVNRQHTLYCEPCSDADNCNSKINTTQVKIGCFECQDDKNPECAADKISNFTGIDLSAADPYEQVCGTIKYYSLQGELLTHRGSQRKDFCDNQGSNVVLCDFCSTDQCNKEISSNVKKYNVCVECEGDDCADDEMPDSYIVTYCHSEDRLFPSDQVCVTTRSLRDGVSSTKRGCQAKNECAKMLKKYWDLQLCVECNDKDLCNRKIDSSKTCYSCNDEDDENCSVELKNLDKLDTCYWDSVKTGCMVYQYLKVTDNDNKTITVRECSTAEHNCETISKNSHKCDLVMCNECKSSNCNSVIQTTNKRKSCIQCSSEDDDECSKHDITGDFDKCSLDDAVHKTCVAHRYLDKATATYKTYRGCSKNNTNICGDTDQTLTTNCHVCSDIDECNTKLDTTKDKKLCIQCDDETDKQCSEQELTQIINVCHLEDDKACLTHKYLDGANVKTIRGCLEKNYCNVTATQTSNSTLCTSCDGDICNKKHNETEKMLCVKCSDIDCTEDLDAAKVQSYCALDDSTECIAYKYTDSSTEKDIIVRDCVKKDSESCDAKLKDDSLGGSLKSCLTCSDSNLCNLKTNRTEISGVPPRIILSTAVQFLSTTLIFMVVTKVVV